MKTQMTVVLRFAFVAGALSLGGCWSVKVVDNMGSQKPKGWIEFYMYSNESTGHRAQIRSGERDGVEEGWTGPSGDRTGLKVAKPPGTHRMQVCFDNRTGADVLFGADVFCTPVAVSVVEDSVTPVRIRCLKIGDASSTRSYDVQVIPEPPRHEEKP
jgi:hypothetical protein